MGMTVAMGVTAFPKMSPARLLLCKEVLQGRAIWSTRSISSRQDHRIGWLSLDMDGFWVDFAWSDAIEHAVERWQDEQ
ncbi:MAG: hypothetical protein B7Z55_13015, partial [Planctomycetales bacterium 12-60-4]